MKRIRLTIEWDGACSERDWACVLSSAIEGFDSSGVTRVTESELLTAFGTTAVREIPARERFYSWLRLQWRVFR